MLLRIIQEYKTVAKAIGAVVLAIIVYLVLPASMPEPARRVSAIFIIAALFWALEIIPLYGTSIMVVILLIFTLCRPGGVLGMDQSGYKVFLIPFGSPIIILFFGGFVIGRAMHKYHIDRIIALKMIDLFGRKPFNLMLGFMAVTAFLSMWMSNTATTAMMVVMIQPLLKQLENNPGYRKALVLSIPFAANLGGMGTPIGTPPNAIALGLLADQGIHLNFISWMKMAIPLVIILMFFVAFLLFFTYSHRREEMDFHITFDETIGRETIWTAVIVLFTILLWLSSGVTRIPSAVIALLAAGLFSLFGLLSRDDFKALDWDVLLLMWGGLALGEGMDISGLTDWIVALPVFQQEGFLLVSVFCVVSIVLSSFMSNTATANLIIPIVMVIPGESKILLATTVALSCSLAMALPISTPPNAIAFSTNMIKSKDMLKTGVVISIVSLITILVGFKFIITKAFGLP